MTLDMDTDEFFITDKESLWKGESLYHLYEKAHTPWEWHKPIFDRCKELGILGFSTPFDDTAVDFLEELDMPCYKIASFENIDIPLIKKVASTGKPIIMSTGMATLAELDEAVRTAREYGCSDLVLLKCTSAYPATAAGANLRTLPHMRELFDCEVGISDHTMGVGVSLSAVALGATVIEKHFTTARADGGVDSAFSMEPHELRELAEESEKVWMSLGHITYGPTPEERCSLKDRRSLYIAQDMMAGDLITRENLRSIRPGRGLLPKYYDVVLGKRINQDVKRGTPMSWDLLG